MATCRTNLYQKTITPGLISTILFFGPLLSGQTALRSSPIDAKVVTLHQLQHKVPKAAREEMDKAIKAMHEHRCDDEIEHLGNALRIDPEYVAARNNLAVCLLKNDPASAIAQLEEAIRIDPHDAILFHNLAIAYIITHKLDAAERAARSAVHLNRTDTRMRSALEVILVLEQNVSLR
jgi:Flp pilus assembly protein TadD